MKKGIVITIGDELLQGFTYDSNASWISKYLTASKVNVVRRITLPDCEEIIYDNVLFLLNNEKISYVIITGGLGPTHDDITKNVLKKCFNKKLVVHKQYLHDLRKRFNDKGVQVPENIDSQATILEGSLPIENLNGSALGMHIVVNNINFIVLPGVPLEMKQMLQDCNIFNYNKNNDNFHTFKTSGIYESKLYALLSKYILKNQSFKVAFLPKYSGVNIRISKNKNVSDKSFLKFKNQVRKIIKKYIYTEAEETIQEVVSNKLLKLKLTLSIAESCTGGLISKKMTDLPGASKYLLGSIVAYSNDVKQKILNVDDETIKKYGAASKEVALEMVKGIKVLTNSDVSIATTGISGPSGGSKEKPVGLIYIAISYKDNYIVKKFNLIPNRDLHREIASNVALNMLRLLIEK